MADVIAPVSRGSNSNAASPATSGSEAAFEHATGTPRAIASGRADRQRPRNVRPDNHANLRSKLTERLTLGCAVASRSGERERGKSDRIDAQAVARAVVTDGVERFPAAYLDERATESGCCLTTARAWFASAPASRTACAGICSR
jgi:hypothetical protein